MRLLCPAAALPPKLNCCQQALPGALLPNQRSPPCAVLWPPNPRRPASAAAISLSHALNALLPALVVEGFDEDEAVEGILGPMLAPLEAVALAPGGPLLQSEQALGQRPCANLDCTRLSGASEWDLPSQRCSRCHAVTFCCRECQRIAHPRHRAVCAALAAAQ